MTLEQFDDLGSLASGLRGTLEAMNQLSHDRAVRDRMLAGALYMSRQLYDLAHGLDMPALNDEKEQAHV